MYKSCFLFGHANTPAVIIPKLERAIENEISKGTTVFYVGYHGSFDRIAITALRSAKRRHKRMTVMLLLPYHPSEQPVDPPPDFDGTFYPPLQNTPRKYAIVKANQYMLQSADSIICYVCGIGNARVLLDSARKQAAKRNIRIVNLAVDDL